MLSTIVVIIENSIFCYGIIILMSYFIQAIISSFTIKRYINKKKFFDESTMLQSEYLPSIALVAPAYNESMVIIDSVRSLLTVHYFNIDLVIVNDGSSDDTLEKLIAGFDLIAHDQRSYHDIETKPVKAIYKSINPAFSNLTVIDKVNGRKADAINVGINYSFADYYAVIDLDCILEPNALLMMMEPVLQSTDKKIVAVGGAIGATNDSVIKHGKFITAKTPKNQLPRIQIIEYLRAFFLSRPAWNSINGLLLISGALGLFERQTLIAVGGYSHDSIGEDMDLVMKMHKYCIENKIKYRVEYIPYPLCWTEVPEDQKILSSQRNRWMRGTIECMYKYRKMVLNPRYGVIGMISCPYWIVAEMLAPIIEFFGFIFIICMAIFGVVNWPFATSILFMIYLISVANSFFALMIYYINFRKYNSIKDLLSLFKAAALEPFVFHPKSFKWSMNGYFDYLFNSNIGWGNMTRTGFKTTNK